MLQTPAFYNVNMVYLMYDVRYGRLSLVFFSGEFSVNTCRERFVGRQHGSNSKQVSALLSIHSALCKYLDLLLSIIM